MAARGHKGLASELVARGRDRGKEVVAAASFVEKTLSSPNGGF